VRHANVLETQEYRLAAENVFRRVRATQEASSAPPLSTDVEECMTELRQELDEMLEWQADDTPEHIVNSPLTFVGAQVPPRPGSLKDFLQAHRAKAEEEAREAMDMEIEGVTEVGMKVEVHAEAPGEDRVDVDANVGGDEGRNKGDDNKYVLEDADGAREVEDLCLAMLVLWAGLTRSPLIQGKSECEDGEDAMSCGSAVAALVR
jgi:hypothetical protein